MVITGLENFLSGNFSEKRRIAVIANHTSVTSGLTYSWDEFSKKKINLVKIFSPEHGLFGEEQDQIAANTGRINDIPIVSLYGLSEASLAPAAAQFADIDTVIFDIQDVGARYYTYAATLILFMRAISGSGIEMIVLDRPNPLGGLSVEGPALKRGYESFVGITPVPVRHALTVGEIAVMAKEYFNADINLQVIKMTGWHRSMYFDETGLPWIPPSPNMPSLTSALVYPGMCLLEGTNISEGRGTTRPFEIFGAPFINTDTLIKHPAVQNLKGVILVPFRFRPTFNKYKGELCNGFFLHVTDRTVFEPFKAGVAIVKTLYDECPEFEFLHDVYEFNSTHPAFDLLCGSSSIREMILSSTSIDEIFQSWLAEHLAATLNLKQYYLY